MFLLSIVDSIRKEVAMALGLAAARGLVLQKNAEDGDRAYFTIIDNALKYRANRKIKNNEPVQIVYLLNRFFACAQRDVRIYTGRFSRTIGNVPAYSDPQLIRSAIEFLRKKNTRLSIVILGEPDVDPGQALASHPLLAAISEAEDIRGTVCVSRGDRREWNEFPFHFVIMDSEAARIEFDGNTTDAAAKFGDAHFGARLARIFDEFERRGSPLLSIGGSDSATPG